MPTDLSGVTTAHYDWPREDEIYEAAVGPACDAIRRAILDLGHLPERANLKLELDSSFTFQDFNTSNSKHLPAGCRVYFLQCGATSWPIIGRHLSESAIQGLRILCWSWHQCGVTVGRRMFVTAQPGASALCPCNVSRIA